MEHLANGDVIVDGGMSIDELNEIVDSDLPDDDWDTVGGLVFSTLEHVATPGEAVELEGWHFTVEEVEGRRIRAVRVRSLKPIEIDTSDESADAAASN